MKMTVFEEIADFKLEDIDTEDIYEIIKEMVDEIALRQSRQLSYIENLRASARM